MNQIKKISTRKRVERNITQDLKTGHYLVTQYNGYDDKGAIRRTVTCETLQEAKAIRDKHEFGRKYEGKATINPKITVTQCIEQYISEKNLEETTKSGYRIRLKRISLSPLGKRRVVDVKKIDVVRYLDGLEREGQLSNKTINGDRQLLQAVFNYAMDCEIIPKNVVNLTSKKQEDIFEGTALSKKEIQSLIQAIDTCQDKRLKAVVCLGALQGMRRGEIVGLKWEDITMSAEGAKISIQRARIPVTGTLIEKNPKTKNSRRTIPLHFFKWFVLVLTRGYFTFSKINANSK